MDTGKKIPITFLNDSRREQSTLYQIATPMTVSVVILITVCLRLLVLKRAILILCGTGKRRASYSNEPAMAAC